ncbi:MAG: S41 family peptidase [Spirosomataceae bacterium]
MPTVVLIGHNTASAAEDFLISADNQKHVTKIGERTFGSTGQPYLFAMPGGGNARVCTKKDTYPDGREFVGVGIKPDIEIIPTLQDYMANRDVVLDKALNYLTTKLK